MTFKMFTLRITEELPLRDFFLSAGIYVPQTHTWEYWINKEWWGEANAKKISKSVSEIFNPTTKSHFQWEERYTAPYTFIPPSHS